MRTNTTITLRSRLGQALPVNQALHLAVQIGQALASIHADGMTYGCLQPQAVILDAADRLHLAVPCQEQAPAYRAPEQVSGRQITPAADVYALGCILYEMLTGRLPFVNGASWVAMDGMSARPPIPRQINPVIPKAVERVVLQALVRQPAGRFQNAGEMVEALRGCRPAWASKPLSAWDRLAPGLEARIGLRRLAWLAGLVLILALAIGLGLWGFQRGRSQWGLTDETQQVAALLETGRQQLEAGSWGEAASTCLQALALDPDNTAAQDCIAWSTAGQEGDNLFDRAGTFLDQAQWPEALDALEQLGQTQPAYPSLADGLYQVHRGYGLQLAGAGDLEQAIVHLDAALALQPGDQEICQQEHRANLYLEGRARLTAADWPSAAASLQELYELAPDYQPNLPLLLYTAYLEQGHALQEQGQACAAWQAYDQARQVVEVDTGEASSRREEVQVQCWPPTAKPIPTSTPTPVPSPPVTPEPTATRRPTPRPVHYCYVGTFQGTTEIAFPLISIGGKVLDRNGKGVDSVLVRVSAYNVHIDVRTGQKGGFRVDGLSQPIEWTVSLPDLGGSVQVPITNGGQMGQIEFREKPCP